MKAVIYPYFSNSYDVLKALFMNALILRRQSAASLRSVFFSAEVVVPDEAVKDELNRSLADAQGIASGIRFVTTQAWLDRMNHGSPDVSGRARALEWGIYAVVTDQAFLARPECARLKKYIEDNASAALWPLVSRIAGLFSTYFSYRADWLWNWAGKSLTNNNVERTTREATVLRQHPDFTWQKALWLELCSRTKADGTKLWPTADTFLEIPETWLERMRESEKNIDPLYVFMPRELPPLALPQLLAESRRRCVHLYVQNPSSAFWFDPTVKGEDGFTWFHRNAAVRRALIDRLRCFVTQDTGEDAVFLEDDLPEVPRTEPHNQTVGTEALADMLQLKAKAEQSADIYLRPRENNVLGSLQQAVLEDDPNALPQTVADDDDSFLIVRAPNAVREVQTLCDWIASMIEASAKTDEPLKASDFLVVTPDIDAMAGVIAAVMGARSEEEYLSYHIAGQSELDVNSAARAMLAAMRFVGGAATASEFIELLEMPAFAAARSQGNANVSLISNWLAAAGYRWGLSEAHAKSAIARSAAWPEGGDAYEGTLERALERLVAGNLVGQSDGLVAYDVFAVSGCELGGFDGTEEDGETFEFLLALARAFLDIGQMPERQTAEAWLETTRRFADTLFAGYAKSPEMIAFVLRAASLAQSATEVLGAQEITFETWCSALEKTMRTNKTTARATGRVTFARTGDFVGMPFKCVAVIGLNDGESFPGSSRREEFDLTAAKLVVDGKELHVARRGDRDSRESNRGVFLDLLLAAQRHFYVSYSIGSGSVPANPSVVLQDLKQALAEGLDDPTEIERKLTKTVPALAASPESFLPQMGVLRCRSASLAAAVNKAIESGYLAQEEPFADAPISVSRRATLSVDSLVKFFTYAESNSLKLIGLTSVSYEQAETTPIQRYGGSDFLFRSKVRRRMDRAFAEGMTEDEILEVTSCDPTIGEQSVRRLLVEKFVDVLGQMHEKLTEEMLSDAGVPVRVEGGRLVFEEMRNRPFSTLAVPDHDGFKNNKDEIVVGVIGISENDLLRTFLQFAAVNLMTLKKGYKPIDFVFFGGDESKGTFHYRWHVSDDEGASNTTRLLQDVVTSMLALVNCHAEARPILADDSACDGTSLIWRGLKDGDLAAASCKKLKEAVVAIAGMFDIAEKPTTSKKSKKPKGSPEEIFNAAVASFEDIGIETDARN